MSGGDTYATLEDVRRMIAGTELKQSLSGRPYLVPPREPTDCQDPGPAKEAVPDLCPMCHRADKDGAISFCSHGFHAPKRGTATAAVSAELEEAVKDIARWAYIRSANGRDGETVDAILALVKREREAERAECQKGEQARADSLVKRVLTGEAKAREPLERDLAAAKERIAELEYALSPFSLYAYCLPDVLPDMHRMTDDDGIALSSSVQGVPYVLRFGAFRNALRVKP